MAFLAIAAKESLMPREDLVLVADSGFVFVLAILNALDGIDEDS